MAAHDAKCLYRDKVLLNNMQFKPRLKVGVCGRVDGGTNSTFKPIIHLQIWGSIPTAGHVEMLGRLLIPSCLNQPNSDGYLEEQKNYVLVPQAAFALV